jgi:hypothetical protein
VCSRPALGSQARDRFDITADKCDDFPSSHVVVGIWCILPKGVRDTPVTS